MHKNIGQLCANKLHCTYIYKIIKCVEQTIKMYCTWIVRACAVLRNPINFAITTFAFCDVTVNITIRQGTVKCLFCTQNVFDAALVHELFSRCFTSVYEYSDFLLKTTYVTAIILVVYSWAVISIRSLMPKLRYVMLTLLGKCLFVVVMNLWYVYLLMFCSLRVSDFFGYMYVRV